MERIASATSSSISVKPRLFDDDPRGPNLRIERVSARGLDDRHAINQIGDAGLFAVQYHPRQHGVAGRRRSPPETHRNAEHSARSSRPRIEGIRRDIAWGPALVRQ